MTTVSSLEHSDTGALELPALGLSAGGASYRGRVPLFRLNDDHETAYLSYVTDRQRALRAFAYRLCGDWHTAEDLTQTALVKLYEQWRKQEMRGDTLDGYVRRILVNLYVDSKRLMRSSREVLATEVPEQAAFDHGNEDRAPMWAALATLGRSQRAVLVLRFYEELSVAETAHLLGCSEGTVKSQTARGLEALRRALGGTSG